MSKARVTETASAWASPGILEPIPGSYQKTQGLEERTPPPRGDSQLVSVARILDPLALGLGVDR